MKTLVCKLQEMNEGYISEDGNIKLYDLKQYSNTFNLF